jgi:NADPH:quinone reductase-like Zn-dependent oxidoreductase
MWRPRIGVPVPVNRQVLIKVSLASINPSDDVHQGQYGQPRVKSQPAGFEGVGTVVASATIQWQNGSWARIAFATGLSNWGSWPNIAVAEAGVHPADR